MDIVSIMVVVRGNSVISEKDSTWSFGRSKMSNGSGFGESVKHQCRYVVKDYGLDIIKRS